eukprot:m.4292 g.4292  ORF g.4292 m.4292 type:complete len:269 (-) comp2405_c0_seq1:139-945(-)
MSSERKPLVSPENALYSPRAQSREMQLVEKTVFALLMLLSTATIIYTIIMGIKMHAEHVLMGVSVGLLAIVFVLLCRLYRNDVVQERYVIYLAAFALFAICVSSLVYASKWKEDGGGGSSTAGNIRGCDTTKGSFFSAKDYVTSGKYGGGVCVTAPPGFPANATTRTCMSISDMDRPDWTMSSLVPAGSNGTTISCQTARNWVQTCTGRTATWTCPSPSPPPPPPSHARRALRRDVWENTPLKKALPGPEGPLPKRSSHRRRGRGPLP